MNSSTLWFLCLAALIVGILFALGTRQLSEEEAVPQAAAVTIGEEDELVVFRLLNDSAFEPAFDEFGRAVPAVDGENFIASDRLFTSETITIELGVDGAVEYKALMNQGDALVYEWNALEGDVYYDFHAHPPDADPDFFTRYREGEGQTDQGAILAPYDGQHGWYWLNLSDAPVTVQLRLAGFYDEVVEIPLY